MLRKNHLTFTDVVFVNLFLEDMSDFKAINSIYCHYFPQHLPASRACIEADLFSVFGCHVALSFKAICSEDLLSANDSVRKRKEVLHVKSYSRWAPLCIGPYAQANRVIATHMEEEEEEEEDHHPQQQQLDYEIILVAGQISLDPGTMQMVHRDDVQKQSVLCKRHVHRVLSCLGVSSGFKAQHLVSVVIYLTRMNDQTTSTDSSLVSRWQQREGSDGDAELEILKELQLDELKGSMESSVPVVLCEVPRLPRDARIEIETVAVKNPEQLDVKSARGDMARELRTDEFVVRFQHGRFCSAVHLSLRQSSTAANMRDTMASHDFKQLVDEISKDVINQTGKVASLKIFVDRQEITLDALTELSCMLENIENLQEVPRILIPSTSLPGCRLLSLLFERC